MEKRRRGYRERNEIRRRGRLEKTNKHGIVLITLVVAVFALVIWNRIGAANEIIDKKNQEIDELENQYNEQVERALRLEERKVEVQTTKYIIEVAKQLGLVFPDEIIYKPSN
ncbi:MAG: hypothetical protein E7266_02220 [Lachnospiraceae bacterium]|nr:hypothetical protein [Lachnospiraceae bacterium]